MLLLPAAVSFRHRWWLTKQSCCSPEGTKSSGDIGEECAGAKVIPVGANRGVLLLLLLFGYPFPAPGPRGSCPRHCSLVILLRLVAGIACLPPIPPP